MNRVVRFLLYPFISFKEFLRRNIVVIGISKEELVELLEKFQTQKPSKPEPKAAAEEQVPEIHYLVDTSAIIDGRLTGIAEAGFLPGVMVVPECVLQELRSIAGSSDPAPRSKGRRGLERVAELSKNSAGSFYVLQSNKPLSREVDDELLFLAHTKGFMLITTDYSLATMAEAKGVRTLNINALAVALRPVFIQGETFSLKILHSGTEPDQGVGYLEDGTMVIVEKARRFIEKTVEVQVARTTQSATGMMVFATLVSPQVRAKR